jgi:hypothetical protein
MKNLHTFKLTASSIGSAAPRTSEPAPVADVEAAPTQDVTDVVEQPPAPRPARPATGLRRRLLTLAAVELAATLCAVSAAGIHNTAFRIAAAGLALTVALVVAIETLASSRRTRAPRRAAAGTYAAAPRRPLTKSKIALLAIMAIGFASFFSAGGTFSSFSAETENPASAIQSGTLLLSNTVNSGSACFSYAGANNVNAACTALFDLTGLAVPTGAGNIAPGYYGGVAKVVVSNTGSLNASKLELYAPSTTDCTDTQTQTFAGAFNTGSLCSQALLYVQEVGTNHHYCWFGVGVGTSTCGAPFSLPYNATTGTGTAGSGGHVYFTGTPNGTITSGDTIQISEINTTTTPPTYNVVWCPASSTAWIGDATATNVTVGACTVKSGSNGSFDNNAVVTDYTTTNTTLAGANSADSIHNFDTSSGTLLTALPLWPTTGDGTANSTGFAPSLPASATRTFYVGVFLPSPSGAVQNSIQAVKSTFSLIWHIEQ